jgi:hypothetical protein
MSKFSLPMSYDKWKISTPWDDEKVAFVCENCDEAIYVGEEYISTDDGRVHEDCFDEYAWNTLGATRAYAEEVK